MWPNQLKTLVVVSAELQSQCKVLHEFSVASTVGAARELQNTRTALSAEAALMIEKTREAGAESRQILLDTSTRAARQFEFFLKEHRKLLARMEAKSEELKQQENELQRKRAKVMLMPIWKRLWLAINPGGLFR